MGVCRTDYPANLVGCVRVCIDDEDLEKMDEYIPAMIILEEKIRDDPNGVFGVAFSFKIFGHAGQAKLDAFLKTRHEFEVKGSKVLGRCDICEKAKHTRSHVPGANAPILPDQPNVVHVDTTFPGMPSLNGAICAHDFLCGRPAVRPVFTPNKVRCPPKRNYNTCAV